MMKRIYLIGVGLIGGSLALDIKKQISDVTIYGFDRNEAHLDEALALGIIDIKATLEDVVHCDTVILATPVDASAALAPRILSAVSPHTLVMDVGSTKSHICNAVASHPKRCVFLATHPIAGTEFSGPRAAVRGLFKHQTIIICESMRTASEQKDKALKLFAALKMHVREMTPEAHDTHMAYVSHLSHISAFMLGKTVIDKETNTRNIFDMAGSGFASTVRLAKSNPQMWGPIFEQNKTHVVEALEAYLQNLIHFKTCIQQGNSKILFEEMHYANQITDFLKEPIKTSCKNE